MPPVSTAATSPQAATRAVSLLALAAFFSGAAIRLCDGLIPRLSHEFTITPGQAGAVVTGFAMAYGVMQLLFGPLADRYGKARVLSLAVWASAATALAGALAPGFDSLVWLRTAWGVAAAGVIPLAMAWIGDAVPLDQRQATLARLLLGTVSGMMAGQLAGGLFADSALGWRGAFAFMAIGHLGVAALLSLRLSTGAAQPQPGAASGFIAPLRVVLASPWSRRVLAAGLAEGVFLFGPLAYLPTYLHERFGLSISAASALVALFAVGGAVYALTARATVRRLGQRRMTWAGGALMGAGYLAWVLSPLPWTAGPIALLVGYGGYLYHNTLQTHATQMAPTARASATALFAFCLFTGQAIGAWFAGWAHDQWGAFVPLLASAGVLPATAWAFARRLRQQEP